jgi:hypothetical protein
MRRRVPPADLRKVTTYPLAERRNKVSVSEFARPGDPSESLESFLDGLSDVLAVRTLRDLASTIAGALAAERTVAWAIGAHVVKVGQSPVLIRMMEEGALTALALNGAGAIHDWEVAAIGATSEDVPATATSSKSANSTRGVDIKATSFRGSRPPQARSRPRSPAPWSTQL